MKFSYFSIDGLLYALDLCPTYKEMKTYLVICAVSLFNLP